MQDTLGVESAVAEAFEEQRSRVLATLIRLTGDWDLAEECVQDAFVRALQRWPVDGVPRSPGAWSLTLHSLRRVTCNCTRRPARPLVTEKRIRSTS